MAFFLGMVIDLSFKPVVMGKFFQRLVWQAEWYDQEGNRYFFVADQESVRECNLVNTSRKCTITSSAFEDVDEIWKRKVRAVREIPLIRPRTKLVGRSPYYRRQKIGAH